jgi:hypothetical protein
MKVILIDWEDATNDPGDVAEEEAGTIRPRIMRSCGWLVRETDEHVQFAWEYDQENREWRGVQTVPRGMIRRIKILKEEKIIEYSE